MKRRSCTREEIICETSTRGLEKKEEGVLWLSSSAARWPVCFVSFASARPCNSFTHDPPFLSTACCDSSRYPLRVSSFRYLPEHGGAERPGLGLALGGAVRLGSSSTRRGKGWRRGEVGLKTALAFVA